MAGPTIEQKRQLDRKLDIIQRRISHAGSAKKPAPRGITIGEFHRILDKASQPIEESESDSE